MMPPLTLRSVQFTVADPSGTARSGHQVGRPYVHGYQDPPGKGGAGSCDGPSRGDRGQDSAEEPERAEESEEDLRDGELPDRSGHHLRQQRLIGQPAAFQPPMAWTILIVTIELLRPFNARLDRSHDRLVHLLNRSGHIEAACWYRPRY
jgi:hypothetical protein